MSATRPSLTDWPATAIAATGVVSALSLFDLVQRVAIRFGDDSHQRAVVGMARGINLAVRSAGVPVRAEGLENVRDGQHYIVVANHQSILDISMASEFLAKLQPRYVSKIELARGVPGVSYNLRKGGSALINRKDPPQARAVIQALADRVRTDRWSVVIFPEGTRSKTGAIKPFREAGLRTLISHAPGVPILPVTTIGGSRLFSRNMKPLLCAGTELVMRIHPEVTPVDPTDAAAFTAFVEQLRTTIESALPERDRSGNAG